MSSDRGVPVGEWNTLECSIGQRGMGKSTYQCARALQMTRKAGGAYVIGHSLGARLPKRLPKELGGQELPIVYHNTIRELEAGLRRRPSHWHILAPPLIGEGNHKVENPESADDLLRYSIRLSTSLREQAFRREYPLQAMFSRKRRDYLGIKCVPVIVIIDEGIALEAAAGGARGRSDESKWFLQYIYSLRHLHIALMYAIQESNARSWRLLEAATAIHVFAIRHQWALLAIEAAGASKDQIEEIRSMGPYERVTFGGPIERPAPARIAKAEEIDSNGNSQSKTTEGEKEPG